MNKGALKTFSSCTSEVFLGYIFVAEIKRNIASREREVEVGRLKVALNKAGR